MAIRQLSVFIENKKGKLSDAVKTISEAGINMRAMSIGDSDDFGILRLIVSDTAKAYSLLSEDMIVKVTDVIAVKMSDKEGALYTVLRVLEKADINVEYTYAFTARELGAYVVFRVNDVEAAEKALSDKGIVLMTEDEIRSI
ncbi:MAG: amino acid-binding protein [Lachnospiraceae bacterium]|nr:amino acid-binding protein [Lachnospiraceae bacterium]MBP5415687.1 amino acid-binding protein [Lachnospiraceae bacterium]MBP5745564.1 amino acid-binding protein [Lachnospiraceae bacterium]